MAPVCPFSERQLWGKRSKTVTSPWPHCFAPSLSWEEVPCIITSVSCRSRPLAVRSVIVRFLRGLHLTAVDALRDICGKCEYWHCGHKTQRRRVHVNMPCKPHRRLRASVYHILPSSSAISKYNTWCLTSTETIRLIRRFSEVGLHD